jgi:5'-deoxynucleotidase YfbR-like HD superfamily hydrolase
MNLPRNIRYWFEPWELDAKGRKRFGTWSQSFSGTEYWIMDPRPDEVNLLDIVMGLSNAARYRGQTKFFYPVLTHCILVSRAVEDLAVIRGWSDALAKEAAFEGLLHDASEAYLGDVARPLKRMRAMREYCRVEKLWEDAICTRFEINSTEATRNLVHEVDHRIVKDEVQVIMRDPDMWKRKKRYLDLEPLGVGIPNWNQAEIVRNFYLRYNELRPNTLNENLIKLVAV